MNEVLYPNRCLECLHLLDENYGNVKSSQCQECIRLAPYGIYLTPAGEMKLA